jgi:biopolymer transport protein ExbB
VIEYFWAGGPVMVPIAIASIVSLAAFLERLWALRRGRIAPRGFVDEVIALVQAGRREEAAALCRGRDVAVTRIFSVALEFAGEERAALKDRLEEVGRREAAELERGLPVLSTVGALGPLLGLLGTVGGMIVTFESVQRGGAGDPRQLAGGISQALITTFAGLCVAIPAVVAHRYLLSRVDALLGDLEEASVRVLDASLAGVRAAERDA